MQAQSQRQSVDLSGFPDLVVIYLGIKVTRWRGLKAMLRIGPGLSGIQRTPPDGLLAHEGMFYSLTHIGFRQYWRDLDSLERFTRSEPHKTWWRDFTGKADPGAGFWHETYTLKGGMEALYLGLPKPIGFGLFAPARDPIGPHQTARKRLNR